MAQPLTWKAYMNSENNPVYEEGSRYIPFDKLNLAVQVARAIDRPLLLYGQPGSGKSSLAKYVAYKEDLRYYEHVTTSRTQARDLLWSYDDVRRLGDAQVPDRLKGNDQYVVPGTLWWAFDRDSAEKLGTEPFQAWNQDPSRVGRGAVVLVDEIDKADSDLPNGLLAPLVARRFAVTDIDGGEMVEETGSSLIVITSNRERKLPQAFERRCVVYRIPSHGEGELREITDLHLLRSGQHVDREMLTGLMTEFQEARRNAHRDGRREPSTAEFLDAVSACAALGDESVSDIVSMIFTKDADG
ncbi:MAG: AAA family ATPase [Kibdelosporangium sp.]